MINRNQSGKSDSLWLKLFNRIFFESQDILPESGLTFWRERILFLSLLAGNVLVLFIFIPGVILLVQEKRWALLCFGSFLYLFSISIMGLRGIRFEFRAAGVSLILYTIGLAIIVSRGPFTGGPIWLFAFALSAGFYLGLRAAFVALGLSGITFLVLGFLIHRGDFSWAPLLAEPLKNWAIISTECLSLNAVASISVAVLVEGLESSLRKERTTTSALEHQIDEREQAENALELEKERFRLLVEELPISVSLMAPDGQYTYINPMFVELFGYTLEDIPTQHHWLEMAFPDPADRKQVVSHLRDDQENYGGGEIGPETFRVSCKDGREKVIHFRSARMASGHQISIYEDITEQRRLETQLRQSQKMESIGIIASGVAHNFRNVLSGISVNTQLIEIRNKDRKKVEEAVRRIHVSVKRGAQLVNELMQFARKQAAGRFEIFDLVDVLKDTYNVIRESFDKRIRIHLKLPESLPVYGNHSGLGQVFINIFTNARDAMPEGGDLNIQVERGDTIEVTISDTGKGMDAATMEKCFDPFFTTKGADGGTGLGLSTSYGIIKEHDGKIQVVSTLGVGTTFKISLPITHFDERDIRKPIVETVRGNSERILIVDDEIDFVKPAEELLREIGYHGASVSSGKKAIDTYRSWRPDVVLLDRNMPEMDGVTCAKKLLMLDPGAKIVFISGYEEEGINGIDEEIRSRIKGYITKPLDIVELSQVLAAIFSEMKT